MSVRNYHHILRNIPEQGKPHVPTFKIILVPPSSSQIKFLHTSTRLPGFTSQKTANIKIQFISSIRVTSKVMAGSEVLQHSAETKPLWRLGIPHFHKFWLCGRKEYEQDIEKSTLDLLSWTRVLRHVHNTIFLWHQPVAYTETSDNQYHGHLGYDAM
jgi:hypothetical protein